MKNKFLGAHFLLKIIFFGNFNSKTPLLLKLCTMKQKAPRICKKN